MARVLVCAALLLLALAAAAKAEAPQDLSLMEVGSATSISASAAAPLREVAALLVEARRSIGQMAQSRQPYNVISNTIKVRRHARPAAVQAAQPAESVNAELVPRMRQPRIHDAQKYGTRNPLDMGGNAAKAQWVDADIVGEDGKPFAPRKQWGVEAGKNERELSPFAKYVQPPAVGAAADVEPKDPNTKLTPLELKRVTSLQLRLKQVLDQLGANVVWDHSKVRNRRLLNEFDELQKESRALMEEYEIRTGVKTIAWQLAPPDQKGLETPLGRVTDIHFAKHPELAGRLLQRGFQPGPPPPTDAMKRRAQQEEEEKLGLRPKKQTVGVAWKRQANGLVKTKVSLEVVGSKGPLPTTPPQMAAKPAVPGVHYPSGKKGSDSLPVQIDVVAPAGEKLKRNMNIAAPTAPQDQEAAEKDAASIQKGIDKQADAKPLKPAKKPEPKINL